MPFSDAQGKDVILSWVKEINPRTVLDIGPGAGAYSDLLREHVNAWQFNALEVWEPYIGKFNLRQKYDHVTVGDIRTVNKDVIESYDLVIIGDVIEHMTKDEARSALLTLTRPHFFQNYNLIISFPVLHLDQGDYEGNPYEAHVDHWTFDEMVEFCKENNLRVISSGHGDVLAWFWIGVDTPLRTW